MSHCLCFICHNVVNMDTHDNFRDKYRELIGMNLCLDSFLCSICCHILDKFWHFKSICLKRSLEYPVLFNEEGTLNLQKRDVDIYTICDEDICGNIDNSIHYVDENDNFNHEFDIFNDHGHVPDIRNEYINNLPDVNDHIDNINLNNDNKIDNLETYDGNDPEYKSHLQSPENYDNNELQSNENINDDNSINEHNNDDIHITNDTENDVKDDSKKDKPKVKSNKKKKEFIQIILSLEEQKAELERNRKEKKYVEAEFKCYNCALGFLFKDTYQAHMMRHEESNGEYRCDICTLRFASVGVLRAHVSLHARRHACATCGRHVRARARHAHRTSCAGGGPSAACHKCARMFKDSSALQQHLKRFHSASSRTYRCGLCGECYTNQAAVRTHMIKHIQRKFRCEFCPSVFSSPYTLTQHKKAHDPTAAVGVHHCVPCDKSFKNRKSLLAHKRNAKQHQEESFECPICSRPCANQRSLNHHIESIHSTTKNYACSRCSARYATDKALKRHMRGHDVKIVAKLAVCHLCGRSFKGNNKLNRHLREVCEKEKLEEQLASYYAQEDV